MSRLLQTVLIFAAGAAFAWALAAPTLLTLPERPERPPPRGDAATAVDAADVVDVELADATAAGVPPARATGVRSQPNAGRRRAVAQALADLEKSPPETEPSELDPTTTARLADRLRARLTSAGEAR